MNHDVTMLYASLLGVLLIVLSWGVSKQRMRARVSLGSGGEKQLEEAIRAHGNFIEYVPLALILMLLAENVSTQAWLLHLFGASLLLGRILHAYGIRNPDNKIEARKIGTSLTWLMILAISLYDLGYLIGKAL